ncbi:serine/threonine protein kinase [Candidatus Uabimicrobium sp. HlEnr_7]|uniref:serine/threonine protein kinase n=1 Tax=Candidatus Uabimicrobium helgolandensis TaxID=3095367 RepID=UPI003556A0E0
MVNELKTAQKAIEIGLISKSQLDECLKIQKDIGSLGMDQKTLGEILISKEYISQEDWQEAANDVMDFDGSFFNDSTHKTIKINDTDKTIPTLEKDLLPQKNVPVIDGYDIIEEIGKGAMGSVYRGVQVSMERPVAIKVLDKKLSKDKNLVDRFTLEARTTARLSHDNIIGGIDAGKTKDDIHYFVMEFIEGQSIGDLLDEQQKLEVEEAANMLMQVADALDYAHEEGIIHRDIKPDNIILTEEGIPKLCDLGLVRDFGNDSRLTMEGHALGTPHYISPEQARGLRDEIDHRSDIYSLGASFYHMITGSPPFPQKNPAVVCAMHATKPFPHPHSIDSSIPKQVCKIIERCTQKKPNKRYQSCQEIVRDLRKFLDNYTPFQDDDEVENEYENDEGYDDYDYDEGEKPLEFIEDKPQPRRNARRRRAATYRAVPVQQVATKNYSTSSVIVAILSVLILFAGSGYFVYAFFIVDKKPIGKDPIDSQPISQEDDFEKIKEGIVVFLPNTSVLDLDNRDIINEEYNKYSTLKKEYKGRIEKDEKLKSFEKKIFAFIDEEQQKFDKNLKIEAQKRYDKIIAEVSKAEKRWKNKDEDAPSIDLKTAHDLLDSFPRGLETTGKGKEILQKKETILYLLNDEISRGEKKAVILRKNKKYPEALKIYEKLLLFALDADKLKFERAIRKTKKEYKGHEKKILLTEGPKFREGIDRPLLKGIDFYGEAEEHVKSYQERTGFEGIVAQELKKLRYYTAISKQLINKKLLKEIKTASPKSTLRKMRIRANDESLWALGVAIIPQDYIRKSYEILKNNPFDNKIYLQYLTRKIANDDAKILYKKTAKSARSNVKKAYSLVSELMGRKYRKTQYFVENTNNIRKLKNTIESNYLKKYALELYFENSFSELDYKTLAFSIDYSLESGKHLKDFFGTTQSQFCSIKELKLHCYTTRIKDVFEIYWKGKIRGNLYTEVLVTPDDDNTTNLGLCFFKKSEQLDSLDKHLFLINYSTRDLVLHEINNKVDNAISYKSQIAKIDKEKDVAVLGYVDGKATYLRFEQKYNQIPIKKLPLNKVVSQKEIFLSIDVSGNRIEAKAAKLKTKTDKIRSTKGYVGFYSNSRAIFSRLKIKGTFDEGWVKDTVRYVQKNRKKYLEIARKRK